MISVGPGRTSITVVVYGSDEVTKAIVDADVGDVVSTLLGSLLSAAVVVLERTGEKLVAGSSCAEEATGEDMMEISDVCGGSCTVVGLEIAGPALAVEDSGEADMKDEIKDDEECASDEGAAGLLPLLGV